MNEEEEDPRLLEVARLPLRPLCREPARAQDAAILLGSQNRLWTPLV